MAIVIITRAENPPVVAGTAKSEKEAAIYIAGSPERLRWKAVKCDGVKMDDEHKKRGEARLAREAAKQEAEADKEEETDDE